MFLILVKEDPSMKCSNLNNLSKYFNEILREINEMLLKQEIFTITSIKESINKIILMKCIP